MRLGMVLDMNTLPRRIQMSRQHPWQTNPPAIVVARPSRFANPYRIEKPASGYRGFDIRLDEVLVTSLRPRYLQPSETRRDASRLAVMLFCERLQHTQLGLDAVGLLGGHDVACWCPVWDSTTLCPACNGEGEGPSSQVIKDAETIDFERAALWSLPVGATCPVCEGTGYARYPCHGDVWLRLVNPEVRFDWVAPC